jgi:hypothetical protein
VYRDIPLRLVANIGRRVGKKPTIKYFASVRSRWDFHKKAEKGPRKQQEKRRKMWKKA